MMKCKDSGAYAAFLDLKMLSCERRMPTNISAQPMYPRTPRFSCRMKNAPTAEKYDAVCHSKYGPEAFDAMLHFTAEAVKNVPHVVMTVVSTMPAEDIEACRKLCENAGAKFRVREYISE